MDLFTRAPGPSYVPAFAGRLLLAMAKGIARATDRYPLHMARARVYAARHEAASMREAIASAIEASGASLDEVKAWTFTQRVIGVYTLIYEATAWEGSVPPQTFPSA